VPSNIEKAISQLEMWVESIQREKDHHGYVLTRSKPQSVAYGFSSSRLPLLDIELNKARGLLAVLKANRHRPELILATRPRHRMLKGTTMRKLRTA
jgi:hypothetical protein